MKTIIKYIWISAAAMFLLTACGKMDVAPTNQISTESIGNTSDGIVNVTNGNYALLKNQVEFNGFVDDNNMYLRQYFQMSDFAGDEIVCGQKTEDPLYYSFTYTHSPDQSNSRFFWYASYKIANGANTVIEIIERQGNGNSIQDQLLGENYFLRAFVHFNLLKFYSIPYMLGNPATNPGVIIRNSTSDAAVKARASVQETYDFIIADLLNAETLMNTSRGKHYVSKEAAQALLSRVYLSMGNYDKAIEFADKVISSGRFSIETAQSYPGLFASSLTHNETIWAVAFTPEDNRGKFGSIASMIYSDGNSGWGEEFASMSYRQLLADNRNDVRLSYVDTSFNDNGDVRKKNGIEVFYITKFSFQDGDPNLSSPILFRLAEMYLNKAEAYAAKGDENNAFAMINEIRKNRGLENDLTTAVPSGKTLIDVVLDERSRELAFEGFRVSDLLRNQRNITRNYWGYHIIGLTPADVDLTTTPTGYENLVIPFNDSRIVYFIPIDEILANGLCVQN
jgi:tetratricopeptide (TPR) repeat protein